MQDRDIATGVYLSSSPTFQTYRDGPTCYRLTISYDGSSYSGWQIQPCAITVQKTIQDAIGIYLKSVVYVIGAGRTDAGVHAYGQSAHFHTECLFDIEKFIYAVNGILPFSIRILNVTEVSPAFHSRYSAIAKEYHYRLCLAQFQSPFDKLYSWHIRRKVDANFLKEATTLFVGTHDFTSFTNEANRGSAAKNAVRTIYRLEVVKEREGVRLEFEGDGFLYKMVRNIVGTVVEVALGKRRIEQIAEIFAAKDRRLASASAPAHGLYLMQVIYPKNL